MFANPLGAHPYRSTVSVPGTGDYSKNLASLVLQKVEAERNLMVSVATGGPLIRDVNDEYKARHEFITQNLKKLGLEDPNPYSDLWDWHGKWSSGDLPTYRSRREYLRELFTPLLDGLSNLGSGVPLGEEYEPTGWERVDRGVDKLRQQLATANDEEDFQAVGLLSREVSISLAQAVFDPLKHSLPDGVIPSETDAARMLEGYITEEFSGSSKEELRRFAKAALALALALQHKRTADFHMAALSVEATTSVVNILAIVSGRRDVADKDDSEFPF